MGLSFVFSGATKVVDVAKDVQKVVKKKNLLPGEGKVGTYKQLREQAYGSKIHAHHMPSQRFMSDKGVKPSEGITFNMSAERHMQTRTFGRKEDLQTSARKTLAEYIKDAKKIYKKEELYNPEIRGGLQEHIKKSKDSFPEIFKKEQK